MFISYIDTNELVVYNQIRNKKGGENMLILKLVIEILILWVWFALFMLALVGRKGL